MIAGRILAEDALAYQKEGDMSLVVWSDKLSVGVNSIDEQHKKLVTLLNQLHDGMIAGKGKDVVGSVLKGLADYAATHFRYEEELFARTGYPDAAEHKQHHTQLVQKIAEIQQKYEQSGPAVLTIQVMNFLKDWLTNHILGVDMMYGPHLAARGIK
jgi:hemerythrin